MVLICFGCHVAALWYHAGRKRLFGLRGSVELFSLKFLLFVLVLLVAYYGIGRIAPKRQWVILLVASLGFYLIMGSWQTLLLMVGMSLITWVGALQMERLDKQCAEERKQATSRPEKKAIRAAYTKRRRVVLVAALVLCLGILGYFKYWNQLLCYVKLQPAPDSLGIILPLGISFYTFQSLGYVIQVYNGKYPPQRDFLRYLLFVTYFPQILQGPINRFDEMNDQLMQPRQPNADGMRRGLLRLGLGLLKKIAIANTLAGVVASVFANVSPNFPGILALWGVLLYSLQIYGDFSGGIDIVEGVSELLGIQMMQNFKQPYFSTSLAEFWRRWHMSLGAFMRDFVFYPLAITKPMRSFGKWCKTHLGKEIGRTLPAGVSNIVVFVLVGVWHGAEPHFVAWGLYNGLVIACSDVLGPTYDRISARLHLNREAIGWRVFAIARTFFVVLLGRYFDYLGNLHDGLVCLRNTFLNFAPVSLPEAIANAGVFSPEYLGFVPPAAAACVVVFVVDLMYERGTDVRERLLASPYAARLLVYAIVAAIIMLAFNFDTTGDGGEFLYANF